MCFEGNKVEKGPQTDLATRSIDVMLDQKAVFYTKLQVLSSSYLNLKNFQQRISFSQVLILNTRLIDAKFEFSLSNVSVGKVKRFSQHNYKVARLALNTTNILTATTTTKTTTCCSQFEKPLEFGLFVRFLALHILERERERELRKRSVVAVEAVVVVASVRRPLR